MLTPRSISERERFKMKKKCAFYIPPCSHTESKKQIHGKDRQTLIQEPTLTNAIIIVCRSDTPVARPGLENIEERGLFFIKQHQQWWWLNLTLLQEFWVTRRCLLLRISTLCKLLLTELKVPVSIVCQMMFQIFETFDILTYFLLYGSGLGFSTSLCNCKI